MTDRDALIHLTAGGMDKLAHIAVISAKQLYFSSFSIGGTFGAIATCPLEVIKVRLQSSDGADLNGKNGNGGLHQQPNARFTQTQTAENPARTLRMRPKFEKLQPQYTVYSTLSQFSQSRNSSLASSHTFSASKLIPSAACLPSTSESAVPARTFLSSAGKQRSKFRNSPYPALIRQSQTGGGAVACKKMFGLDFAVFRLLREVVSKEGYLALFKGVGPNVIGVAPSKAVYFYAYSSSKRFLNELAPPNTPWIHMISAGSAGFLTASFVNPIWLIKTRLQLDRHSGSRRLTILQCAKKIYKVGGVRGFWKGVTASYVGIFETIVQFVLYEYLRASVVGINDNIRQNRDTSDFLHFMLCGGVSKLVATSFWYPHEVCRTRLREEGTKYKGFFQTFSTVWREEGRRGLYRGLTVHLLRTIPNTAITMGTYEVAVYLLANLAS